MFSNTTRTGFGGNSTFGSPAQANPFGTTSQMFGTPTSTFGASAFGQPAGQNVFGQMQPQPQNQLFSSANTSSFGTPAQNAFGSTSLFGQQNPPASTSLFGGTSSFGQQNKQPGYAFSTPQAGGGLFGQTSTLAAQAGMFQPATSSGIFGATTGSVGGGGGGFGMPVQQSGTTIKFQPVTSTDSMQKGGSTTVINTKHHCISCMKEYENKSFEELRLEDYVANRKGPQAGGAFGGTAQPFASTAGGGVVVGGGGGGGGIFGQSADSKPAFGAPNTFAAPAPAFGAATTGNIFGKPAFGSTTTSTSGFGSSFGAPQTSGGNMFGGGATQQNKPFGQATPLFGAQPVQQTTFGAGTNNFFGQNTAAVQPQQQQQSAFFKPAQPTFSTPQTGFAFGQQPTSTQATGLFNQPKSTGFSLFGTTTTTATSAWPATNSFGTTNAFAKPAQPAFGQPTQTGFGTGLQMPQNNLFGTLGPKPAFGTNSSTSLFGNSTLQPSAAFGMHQQTAPQPVTLNTSTQLNDLRTMIANCDPYGYSPHLDNLEAFKPSGTHYVTNPKDIDNYLKETEKTTPNTTPKARKIHVTNPNTMDKWKMFESSYEDDKSPVGHSINRSIKRLTIPRETNAPVHVIVNGRLVEKNAEENSVIGKPLQVSSFDSPSSSSTPPPPVTQSSSSATNPKPSMRDSSVGTETLDASTPPLRTSNAPRVNMGVVNIDTIDDTSQQKFLSSAEVTDTCGIICTRPQYYTLPALDKLAQFKNPDGTCFMKGFTIGRHGYGNVHFPDVMNVAGLNIDELVHFCHKQICIYVNDDTKPPVGEGLNRPAQVTLDRVFPTNTDLTRTSEAFEEDAHQAELEFEEMLRKACARAGTTFVDYRPETGSWVFNVYHFSKYGLLDVDEDDIRREAGQTGASFEASQQDISPIEKEAPVAAAPREHRGLGGRARIERSETDAAGNVYEPPMDLHMSATFDHEELPTRWEQDRQPKRNMSIMQMKYMFFDDESRRDQQMIDAEKMDEMDVHSTFNVSESPEPMSEILQAAVVRPREWHGPEIFVVRNTSRLVPAEKSLLVNRSVMDATLFRGRGFKCGWGAGLKMYALMENKIAEVKVSQVDIDMEAPDNDPFADATQLKMFIGLLQKQTTMDLQTHAGESIPWFHMQQAEVSDEMNDASAPRSLLYRQFKLAESLAEKHPRNKRMAYYQRVWRLLVALWDAPPTQTNINHYRREMFNDWLEHATASTVNALLGESRQQSTPENVLACLSGHKIDDAVDMANTTGHPQLALMVSQLNASNQTRYCVQNQLQQWNHTGAMDLIDIHMQRLYILCSGMPTGHQGVNVLEGMDWLRCLAIYYWYVCLSSEPLEVSVGLYEDAFAKRGHAAAPTSQHCSVQHTWDILFHIMKLYCNRQNSLEVLLSPQTHTSDPNDYRLSWLLQQVFLSMGVGIVSDECHNHTTTSFATQLEEAGQYKWCIFVLLHIKNPVVRRNLVMGVLDRHLHHMDADLEEYIVCSLYVPAAWLHEVKAARSRLLDMHWQAYQHLCHSGRHYEAHEILIDKLTPTLVGNHEFDILDALLQRVEPSSVQITRWKYQGGLIMRFVRFWRVMLAFQENREVPHAEVAGIHMELNQLLMHLRRYGAGADHQHVMVVAEMSKYCASFYTTLMKYARGSLRDMCELNEQFNLAVMPFDYKYAELNKFLSYRR